MKQLQLKKLTVACGMALGAFGFANVASAAAVDVFLAGSTALDPNLEKAIADMCNGSLAADKYAAPAGTTYVCTAKAGLTFVTAGDVLTISKENLGGSGNGIGPVVTGTLARPGITACTGTGSQVISGVTFTTHTGCANAANQQPKGGISDVEPRLFGVTSGLTSSGILGVTFGVAMSEKLYTQLQTLQGKTAGDFSEAQAPTLKSSELRGIMTNNLTDWTGVDGSIAAVGTGTTAVKVCRRGTTSGTQKSFEVRMLGLGCAGATTLNSGAFASTVNNLNDDSTLNNTLGSTVIGTATASGNGGFLGYTGVYTAVINNGSKEVDNCLTVADNQDELAIGFLGTDRLSGAAGILGPGSDGDDIDGAVDKWHYVRIDNQFPSVANVVSGSYDNLWTVSTLNRRTSGYSAQETAVLNEIGKRMGDPAAILSVPFPGVTALPSNGYVWDGSAPVARGERRDASGNINNCQDTLVVF